QMFIDTKQIIVPPVEHFLNVEVKADRDEYQPRDEGTLSVTTRDHNGNAVSAEVALGLIDESVYYIQQDYAGDPRQFYFGRKRQHQVQTQGTFNQKSYARLVEGKDKQLYDDRQIGQANDQEELQLKTRSAISAAIGTSIGGRAEGQAASETV